MPAEITLTVTKFVPLADETPSPQPEQNCSILPELQMNGDTTGAWKRDQEGRVFLCPAPDLGIIAVKQLPGRNDPIVLSFKIASAAGVPALRPTRIVFQQSAFRDDGLRARPDPDGALNFRDRIVTANGVLSVTDHWIHHGRSRDRAKHEAPSWKFWIRVVTADGQFGWIDPGIENSEDMMS